jgi:uncharacterized damage-inducible protein DinB
MPESDPLKVLLAHDRWATMQLIDVCTKLTSEQFERRLDIGPGSLQAALTHVAGAMRVWTDTLAQVEARPRLETDGQSRTAEQLREVLAEAYDAFAAEVFRRPFDEVVTRQLMNGKTIRITRGAVAAHVVTHDMHHRAQCLNMLRQLGITPLPPSGVVEWTWAESA